MKPFIAILYAMPSKPRVLVVGAQPGPQGSPPVALFIRQESGWLDTAPWYELQLDGLSPEMPTGFFPWTFEE